MKLLEFSIWTLQSAKDVSALRFVWVLVSQLLSACARVGAPLLLGYGIDSVLISNIDQGLPGGPIALVCLYSLLILLGRAFGYFSSVSYGIVEQQTQSVVMSNSLGQHLRTARYSFRDADRSELSFAIDSQGGALRQTLSTLALDIIPAMFSALAGLVALWMVAGLNTVGVYMLTLLCYMAISVPLINVHQRRQAAFFKESMRNFGVLSNSVSLWREAFTFRAAEYLSRRYRQDRVAVEGKGVEAYRATKNLYLSQEFILGGGLLAALLLTVAPMVGGTVVALGNVVAVAGVWIAAVGPMQSVGFGISEVAVQQAAFEESREKLSGGPANFIAVGARTGTSPTMQLEGLESVFPEVFGDAVSPLSSGRPHWICGPSGSGKTTILEQITGCRPISDGASSLELRSELLDPVEIAYSPQDVGVLNDNALENASFGTQLSTQKIDEVFERLGLADFTSQGSRASSQVGSGQVSGGEARRIAVARATLRDVPIVVLDEPTAGLDATAGRKMWNWIETLSKTRIVLVATHDPAAPISSEDFRIILGTKLNE